MKAFLQVTQTTIEWFQRMIRVMLHEDCNQSWFLFMNLLLKSIKICMKLLLWLNLCQLSSFSWLNWSSSWVLNWHFKLKSRLSRIAHIFNSTQLDSIKNWVNLTWLSRNLSLTSRELNIEIFRFLTFALPFCIIFW